MKKLLSASEIAALKLPDLPTTKVAIAARAERERWYSEETTGLGGTRRVYEVPAKYLQSLPTQDQAMPGPTAMASRLADSYEQWAATINPDDFLPIRYYPHIRASAGNGALNFDATTEAMYFRRSFIVGYLGANPANLISVRVGGDSMWPTIKPDGTVLIDLSKRTVGEGIFLVRIGEMLLIKRLQPLVGSVIKVISDNKEAYAPYEIDLSKVSDSEFAILGAYQWDGGISR